MNSFTRVARTATTLGIAGALALGAASTAHAALPTGAAEQARATATITSPLIAAARSYYGNYASGSGVLSTKLPTFAQALAGQTSTFTYPAPNATGRITTGGLCVTLPPLGGGSAVSLASCSDRADQTFTTAVLGGGVVFNNSDGRTLAQIGSGDRTPWLGATSTPAGVAFITFTVDSTSVDTASRVATVSGHGVPGQVLVLNDDVQVTAGAAGTWTAQVPDMKLGVNRIKVEAWTGGNLFGTQYADGNIDIAPLTATPSFGARVTDAAMVSGSAEPGAVVVIRDSSGKELARTTANATTGRYSVAIAAPNAAGAAVLSATQIIGGLETAPTAFSVDYGNELDVASPLNDLIVSNGTVSFSGTGAIGAQVTVREKGAQGILGNTVVLANGRWQIPSIATDRFEHSYVVTQTAPGNNVTTQEVTINPGMSNIVAPTATITFSSNVAEEATIGGVGVNGATVTVTSGSTTIGTATVAGGMWQVTVPRSIGTGSHTFTVTQTVGGKPAGSATVTHDFGAPITATSTLGGSTATISGTGTTGARVAVTEAGRQVGTATVANGAYSIPVTGVTTGSHTYTVTQTAPGNIVTTATTTATRASAITVTNPVNLAAGYTPNTAFTFTGTAPRNAGTLTIRNFTGLLIARVPVNPTTGTWEWTRTNMGTATWRLTFTTGEGTASEESYTLPDFAPNAAPALDLKVLNPVNAAVGYTPNTAFTFSGVAKKTAGTVTIRNFTGLLIARVPVNPTTGAWEWTRTNMGTATWRLSFTTDEGTASEEKVTLGDFAPNASQALKFTNPTDPATGYVANTAFTFRGTALPGAKVQLTNFTGLVLANLVADQNGNWSWTRSNMGTSTWRVTATSDKGTPNQQTVTLGDFAPRP